MNARTLLGYLAGDGVFSSLAAYVNWGICYFDAVCTMSCKALNAESQPANAPQSE